MELRPAVISTTFFSQHFYGIATTKRPNWLFFVKSILCRLQVQPLECLRENHGSTHCKLKPWYQTWKMMSKFYFQNGLLHSFTEYKVEVARRWKFPKSNCKTSVCWTQMGGSRKFFTSFVSIIMKTIVFLVIQKNARPTKFYVEKFGDPQTSYLALQGPQFLENIGGPTDHPAPSLP